MNKEKIKIIAENKSTMLRTSPVIMNKPFTNKRNAEKRISGMKGERPNINDKKVMAAIISIAPRIFTNTIVFLKG